jgi:hypothetical protein
VRLALADAFHLRGVQAVDLGATLPPFLVEHATGAAQQVGEHLLQPRIAIDLAGNVPYDAAEMWAERAKQIRAGLQIILMSGRETVPQGLPLIRKPCLEADLKRAMRETAGLVSPSNSVRGHKPLTAQQIDDALIPCRSPLGLLR